VGASALSIATSLVQVLYDAASRMPTYVSLTAVLAFLFLLALYLSQRRDLERLRAWMEAAPDHPAEDMARSEALLDRAETELEEILGVEAPPGAPTPTEATAVAPPTRQETPVPPQPTTSERPALEQITTEREALLPHPRWRRFASRISQPRVLGLIALGAVILGLVGIFGSERLLDEGTEPGREPKPGAVVPQDVTVAVLNGTSVPGLGNKVATDVEVNEFTLGAVGTSREEYDQTVVMYEEDQKRAAQKVAHDLGVNPVQPIDRQTQRDADGADVVVIAGKDRVL
jgi:LytR cell envelope-related transcriptional attenuator